VNPHTPHTTARQATAAAAGTKRERSTGDRASWGSRRLELCGAPHAPQAYGVIGFVCRGVCAVRKAGWPPAVGVARPCMWHMLGGRTGREHDWVYAARRVAWTMRTEPPGLQHPRMSRPHAPGSKRRGSHPGSFGLDPDHTGYAV
jgi:hypothetical protein